jgi:hypothetical protein
MADKNIIDNLFDGMEAIVGGLEKAKEVADPLPPAERDHPDKNVIDVEDAEFTHQKADKKDLLWGVDREVSTFHVFEGFSRIAVCQRSFDETQVTNRRTEMDDGNYKCCGGCLRWLHNKYKSA